MYPLRKGTHPSGQMTQKFRPRWNWPKFRFKRLGVLWRPWWTKDWHITLACPTSIFRHCSHDFILMNSQAKIPLQAIRDILSYARIPPAVLQVNILTINLILIHIVANNLTHRLSFTRTSSKKYSCGTASPWVSTSQPTPL